MKLTHPPVTQGLGKTRSADRRGKVPGTPSTRGLAETLSIAGRSKPRGEQAIHELGVRTGALSADLGEVTAEGLIRFRSVAAASGAEASVAIEVRASTSEDFAEAGIYLDADVSGLGGESRIRISADNVVISDGSDDLPAFEIDGGVLYLRAPVKVRGIDDGVVATAHVAADAITQIVAADGTPGTAGDVVYITVNRTLGTRAVVIGNVLFEEKTIFAFFGNSNPVDVEIIRDSTSIYDRTHKLSYLAVIESSDTIVAAIVGGSAAICVVDGDDTVSGSTDYTLRLTGADAEFAFIMVLELKR